MVARDVGVDVVDVAEDGFKGGLDPPHTLEQLPRRRVQMEAGLKAILFAHLVDMTDGVLVLFKLLMELLQELLHTQWGPKTRWPLLAKISHAKPEFNDGVAYDVIARV